MDNGTTAIMLVWSFWACPVCGRTVKCPNPSYYRPNTDCFHDGAYYIMTPLVFNDRPQEAVGMETQV